MKNGLPRNPMQPFVCGKERVVRFKENAIVRYLLDEASVGRGCNLNDLARVGHLFSQDDKEQFAQLIGYSLAGYHELSYVSDQSALVATRRAREELDDREIGGCRDVGCEIHCGVEEDEKT